MRQERRKQPSMMPGPGELAPVVCEGGCDQPEMLNLGHPSATRLRETGHTVRPLIQVSFFCKGLDGWRYWT